MNEMVFLFLLGLVFVSMCTQAKGNEEMISLCKDKCLELKTTIDFSSGPCLMDPIRHDPNPENVWVCDVAHSPRKTVDNFPYNQCSYYVDGFATHFIEVDEDCNLIRSQ
jgi:hypothetical protein